MVSRKGELLQMREQRKLARQAGGRSGERMGNNVFLRDRCLSCPTLLGLLLSLLWKHVSYAGNGTSTRTPTWCPADHHPVASFPINSASASSPPNTPSCSNVLPSSVWETLHT